MAIINVFWRIVYAFLIFAYLPITAFSANVTFDWNVTYVENINLDGLYPRRVIGVNGTYPPPIINVNQSDFVTVNMYNGLTDNVPTGLHAHGMFFNNTNYWDGAVGVTQCPTPAGQSVEYQILNSVMSPQERQAQWGTFWVHSHYGGQYVDGLRTPNIIHATKEPYTYDDDFTIILADWYHEEYPVLVPSEFLNVKNPTGAEPIPNAGLVYIAHTSAFAPATYLPGYNENATLPFEAGKTYRIRLINMAALSMIHFWMEGHTMNIIEADGVDMEMMQVDSLTLSVAQRYSILVKARNDTSQNWLMHANLDPDMFDFVPADLQLNLTSTISYKEGNPIGSDQPFIDYTYFDDSTLVPIVVEPQLPATAINSVTADFSTYSDGKNYAMFNGTTYVGALTPSMYTMVSMPPNETALSQVYGPNGNAIVVDHLENFQLTIYNADTGHHPFHLHGHHFQLIHKAQDYTSSDPTLNPPFPTNSSNPARRDTVVVPGGGSVTLNVIMDNPGAWFLHCHIAWHLTSGLAIQIIEAPDQFRQNVQIPSYLDQQCKAGGYSPTGNAGGLESLTNFGALPEGPKPLISGWTSKAVGTFVACLITALLGVATVAWYGFSSNNAQEDDEDDEDEDEK